MKMIKAYFDCGDDCVKVVRPAKNKAEFISIYGGNGEIIKIEEVTSDYPIDTSYLLEKLLLTFGEAEAYAIQECVRSCYENINE